MNFSLKKNLLGENITKARKSRNISQAELAEKIGVDRSSISHYESGTKCPTLQKIELIAEVLDVKIEELLIPTDNTSMGTTISFKQPVILEGGEKIYTPEDLTDEDLYLIKKLHEADEKTREIVKKILDS